MCMVGGVRVYACVYAYACACVRGEGVRWHVCE